MTPLDKDAIKRLTGGLSRAADQSRVLDELGIPWKIVRGGLVVLDVHVVAWMENKPVRQSSKPRLDLVR